MNPSKVKMVADNDNHYVMHDGRSEFKVPKAGLSKDLHAKILKMADGGQVPSEVNASFATPGAAPTLSLPQGFDPENNIHFKNTPQAALTEEEKAAAFPASVSTQPVSSFSLPASSGFDPSSNIATDNAAHKKALEASSLGESAAAEKKKPSARVEPGAGKESPKQAHGRSSGAGSRPETVPESDMQKALKEKMLFKEAEMGATADIQQKAIDHMAMLDSQNQRNAAHAQQQGQALIAKHQAAVDDMAKINTTVDPDRFWASRSTPQKILSILGIALGGVNGGPNQSMEMIQKAIDRDIEAQKDEHQIRLARGKAVAEGYQTDYSLAHSMAGDDLAANELARSSANARAKALVDQMATKFGGYQARPDLAILSQELAQKQALANANAEHIKSETTLNYTRAQKLRQAGPAGIDTSGAESAIDNLANSYTEHGIGAESDAAMSRAKLAIIKATGASPRMGDDVEKMLPSTKHWKILSKEERARIVNNAKKYVRQNAGKSGAGGASTEDLDIEE